MAADLAVTFHCPPESFPLITELISATVKYDTRHPAPLQETNHWYHSHVAPLQFITKR